MRTQNFQYSLRRFVSGAQRSTSETARNAQCIRQLAAADVMVTAPCVSDKQGRRPRLVISFETQGATREKTRRESVVTRQRRSLSWAIKKHGVSESVCSFSSCLRHSFYVLTPWQYHTLNPALPCDRWQLCLDTWVEVFRIQCDYFPDRRLESKISVLFSILYSVVFELDVELSLAMIRSCISTGILHLNLMFLVTSRLKQAESE